MAQAGVYAPGPVVATAVTVRVNGVVRDHVHMSWSGDTSGGLPDQVVSAGTGMRSRTGSIRWAQESAVETEPPHPLRRSNGWPPREGDPVVIDATVDTGSGPYSFRRFTGRLGRTTGSLTDGTLTSAITDMLADDLNAQVTVDPIVADQRHYMRSHWVMYQAVAQAGLGAIPGPDADTVLWNGYQGGLRPLVGEFVSSGTRYGDGYGLSSWTGAETAPDGTARAGRDVLVIARAGTGYGSNGPAVKLRIGGRVLTLTYWISDRRYTLHATGEGGLGSWTRTDDGPLAVLAMQIMGHGIRVWTGLDTWVDVTGLVVPAGDAVTGAGGTAIAGVSVRYLSSGSRGPAVVGSTCRLPVSITRSALEQERIPATRGVENVTARSVVDSWSEATLGALWMDEHGKPVVVARDRLVTRPASRTVRIEERVFSGSWSIGDDSVRSRVEVTGQMAAIQQGPTGSYRATVHQDTSVRGTEASMAEPEERFIEAPAEVEWGPIQLVLTLAGGQGSELSGSWYGGIVVQPGDNGFWFQQTGTTVSVVAERLGQRTIKLSELVRNLPAGGTFYPRFAETGTSTHPAIRGMALPVIRAEWVTTWADYTVTGAAKGPSWAEPLAHDAGWWLTPADAQRVADALAVEVTQPMPTLESVEVLWDPTRQIGDVERWTATDSKGRESWTADVLVVGYSESWDGDVPSQSVDVRVISWTDPLDGKTYDDLRRVYGTYHQIEGYQPTYQELYDALPDHF